MINKNKITSDVFEILQFQALALGLDMTKLDKKTRSLVVTAFVEGSKYLHNQIGNQNICPKCGKRVYKTADIEFLANIGVCSSCDHIEGDK